MQSLGFDSSLMDLVTEVEQMVAYRQANMAAADRQPARDPDLPSRVALLHRSPSTQVHAVGKLLHTWKGSQAANLALSLGLSCLGKPGVLFGRNAAADICAVFDDCCIAAGRGGGF